MSASPLSLESFERNSVRPNHLSDQNVDHDYYFELLTFMRERGAQSIGR